LEQLQPTPGTRRRDQGFTLVEVILVTAIIAVVASIAIPGLAQARVSANETSAIGTLKTIGVSNFQYRTRFGRFAADINDLWSSGYLDPGIAAPFKAGYNFNYVGTASTRFEATAAPTDPGASGNRHFFVDQSGLLRQSYAGPATVADDPL